MGDCTAGPTPLATCGEGRLWEGGIGRERPCGGRMILLQGVRSGLAKRLCDWRSGSAKTPYPQASAVRRGLATGLGERTGGAPLTSGERGTVYGTLTEAQEDNRS